MTRLYRTSYLWGMKNAWSQETSAKSILNEMLMTVSRSQKLRWKLLSSQRAGKSDARKSHEARAAANIWASASRNINDLSSTRRSERWSQAAGTRSCTSVRHLIVCAPSFWCWGSKVGSDQEKWSTGVQLFSKPTIWFYSNIVLQHWQLRHCSTIDRTDLTFSNSSLKQLYVNVSESCQAAWDKRSMRWTEGKKKKKKYEWLKKEMVHS